MVLVYDTKEAKRAGASRPFLGRLRSSDRFHDDEEYDGTENGDKQAPEIESRDACAAKRVHKPAADERADDANDNIKHDTGAGRYDHRSDPAGDCAKYDPKQNSHSDVLVISDNSKTLYSAA